MTTAASGEWESLPHATRSGIKAKSLIPRRSHGVRPPATNKSGKAMPTC
jgi:hypothetical protein